MWAHKQTETRKLILKIKLYKLLWKSSLASETGRIKVFKSCRSKGFFSHLAQSHQPNRRWRGKEEKGSTQDGGYSPNTHTQADSAPIFCCCFSFSFSFFASVVDVAVAVSDGLWKETSFRNIKKRMKEKKKRKKERCFLGGGCSKSFE